MGERLRLGSINNRATESEKATPLRNLPKNERLLGIRATVHPTRFDGALHFFTLSPKTLQ
jgi:hypothetical protein